MSNKKVTVLHELLAVETGLSETANRVSKETSKTLGTKQSLFAGMTKEHQIFDEESQHLVQAPEIKEVESTVDEQIDYVSAELARYWDVTLQKEEANQRANGDIIIEGTVIASNVPSIVLLGMEKKLTALLGLYNNIPTLDAAKTWVAVEGYPKEGVFVTKTPMERQHVVTVKNWIEVSPATKEFKAQLVQKEDISIVGKYIVNEFSGAVSSLNKATRIQKLTAMIRAVKTARQRANNTEVNTELSFGAAVLGYING